MVFGAGYGEQADARIVEYGFRHIGAAQDVGMEMAMMLTMVGSTFRRQWLSRTRVLPSPLARASST